LSEKLIQIRRLDPQDSTLTSFRESGSASPARNTIKNQNQSRYFEEPEQKISRYVKQGREIERSALRKLLKEISNTTSRRAPTADRKILFRRTPMERAEIAELFYNALINLNDLEKLDRFLSAKVQWTLSAADPHTVGKEAPPNAITFSGNEGCRQLAMYFQQNLKVFSGDLTGCISHHQLVFVFGRVRLGAPAPDRFAETNIAARLTFRGSKIINGQIRISWPLIF
jgi:hypothetical protein